jgi:hypothetical protein
MDQHGGMNSGMASVVVLNARPTIDSIAINPDPGYNDMLFDCAAAASDTDGTIVSMDYTWTDGTAVVLGTGPTFDANTASLYPGETISCTVMVMDDQGATESSSVSLTLTNRAPNTPNVYITWNRVSSFPQSGDTLTCNVSSSSQYDPDGTPISITYGWFTSAPNAPATGQTMPGSYVFASEIYTCVVTFYDGSLSSNGFDTVQATSGGGTQIQSGAMVAMQTDCGDTSCDWSLNLPDSNRLDFVAVQSGVDPLDQYELTKDLYVATTEMRQGDILSLMGTGFVDVGGSQTIGSEYPMSDITWSQAALVANAVTEWHNQSTGESLQSCFVCSGPTANDACTAVSNYTECTGYRLPTEAEWEYAARAGSELDFWTSTGSAMASGDGCTGTERLLNGGSSPFAAVYTNYCGSGTTGALEVASLMFNGFGLFDVHGNVAEWTADDEGCGYPASGVDPFCSIGGNHKVVRGGSWIDTLDDQAAGAVDALHINGASETIGFRLVRNQ